jgi:hypothetical protein
LSRSLEEPYMPLSSHIIKDARAITAGRPTPGSQPEVN